jgi:protein-S-isoprenylcysteine O-methyltransferase Ste14
LALLKDQLIRQGSFLFRWRSFLPLLLAIPALTALPQSGYFEIWFGESAEEVWDVFCILVAISGLAIRIATVGFAPAGTSGRNTFGQRAEVLNTSGLYSVVRNPLYVGNIITLLGFLLAFKVWWVPLFALPLALMYYERIILAEEAFLTGKFGAAYETWAARTPAWLPALRQWRRPDLPFSLRTALRREYHGMYLIVGVLALIEMLTDVIGEGQSPIVWLHEDPGWVSFFAAGTMVYLALRLVRKKTRWLVVEGR